jgi:hypothetical protein
MPAVPNSLERVRRRAEDRRSRRAELEPRTPLRQMSTTIDENSPAREATVQGGVGARGRTSASRIPRVPIPVLVDPVDVWTADSFVQLTARVHALEDALLMMRSLIDRVHARVEDMHSSGSIEIVD